MSNLEMVIVIALICFCCTAMVHLMHRKSECKSDQKQPRDSRGRFAKKDKNQ